MDPALAGIIGGAVVALIAGGFALLQTQAVAKAKAKADENTRQMESVKVQIDGWDRLHDAYRQEITRLGHALGEERAIAEAFAAKADRLERELRDTRTEVEWCRTNHRPGGN